ncbi:MAG TPA: CsbD family protein [Acidiferrobacterales bacterium]|nr:CsbD family protein [Acidiferrobacterales bacterium]
MNEQQLKGKWNQVKGEVKKRWGRLTDDDLMEVEGNYDKLIGKIQERHGESEENVKKWMDNLD